MSDETGIMIPGDPDGDYLASQTVSDVAVSSCTVASDADNYRKTDMDNDHAEEGRWYQFNTFLDTVSPHLSPIARDVWLCLFRHSDKRGYSTVTRSRIATMLNVSTRTVSSGISELRERGLAEKTDGFAGYLICLGLKNSSPPLKNTSHMVKNISHPPLEESFTHGEESFTPPLKNSSPPLEESFTPPLKNSSHITESYIQNISTEKNTEDIYSDPAPVLETIPPPKQATIPGTQRMTWEDKAIATRLFEVSKQYPSHRRTHAKLVLKDWLLACKESGGHDVLAHKVCQHIEASKRCKQWKDGFIPSLQKYISERRWENAVADVVEEDDSDPIMF
jgi:ribosomal protein L32/biotin operon repressor